jgi:hypothetical protein
MPVHVKVYGPDGLGKTAMGGHPRRLLQAASNSTAASRMRVAADGKDTSVGGASNGGVLPGMQAGGQRNQSALAERRRAQESSTGGVSLAVSQQQPAFRVHAGMQVRASLCLATLLLIMFMRRQGTL